MWELLSNGQFPYSDFISDAELMTAIEHGLHLYQPNNTPTEYYNIILKCCNIESMNRPTMQQLLEQLSRMQRGLFAFQPTKSEEYEPVKPDQITSDLIFYTQYMSPAAIEYRPVTDFNSIDNLYEKVSTFDNFVYRKATSSRSTELYEATARRGHLVFSAILNDELRPPGTLYVMRDKAAARSDCIRRTHMLRTAIETPHNDPQVYQVASKSTQPTASYQLPIPINLSSDREIDSLNTAPELPTRGSFSSSAGPELPIRKATSGSSITVAGPALPARAATGSSAEEHLPEPSSDDAPNLYKKPERRRLHSLSDLPQTQNAPPLPARSGDSGTLRSSSGQSASSSTSPQNRPMSDVLPQSGQRARSATLGRSPHRPVDADQLTATEWDTVEIWMQRPVSRVQAEQWLLER
jgi:hypothetical protein